MNGHPKISVIIPFKELDETAEKCIKYCQQLEYPNFDIILLPDFPLKKRFEKCMDMATGPVHQAVKRNIAIAQVDSAIFASIDSDAYPKKNWLKNAVQYFKDETVGAVAGPNLVMPGASKQEEAAVKIVHSKLAGVEAAYYIKKYNETALEFKEAPSSNLILRRNILLKFGGYDADLPTGEDSKLGFDIRKHGYKIVYSPDVCVYHHRRPLYKPHLKRVFEQAKDKAGILREYFGADKLIYFGPALFLVWLIAGLGFSISGYMPITKYAYIFSLIFYSVYVGHAAYHKNDLKMSFLLFTGMFLTHLTYGLGFILGFFKRKH